MAQQDFDEVVKKYGKAMSDFFNGDPEPINNFYSDSDEISLAQLSGPFVLGRKQVTETVRHNATKYRESMDITFRTLAKYVADEFGYIVQIEQTNVKIGGNNEVTPLALRVTSIFRQENSRWRLLHRHVDSTVFQSK
jgi:ketosteroid isomerase-like protein